MISEVEMIRLRVLMQAKDSHVATPAAGRWHRLIKFAAGGVNALGPGWGDDIRPAGRPPRRHIARVKQYLLDLRQRLVIVRRIAVDKVAPLRTQSCQLDSCSP